MSEGGCSRGIRRTLGSATQGKAPATADVLASMLALTGRCWRWGSPALQVDDLTETPDGLRVLIRHSKTDQEGQGQEVAIPRGYRLRPVEAVQAWLAARGDHRGPSVPARAERQRLQAVALKAPSVAVIVQRYATLAGHAAGFAGHSLRSGFLTSGAEAGASIFKMMGGCYGVGRAGASPGGAEGGAMAEALRQAEAVRKTRGLLARLQAALRGE